MKIATIPVQFKKSAPQQPASKPKKPKGAKHD
jgi:hypothetical protein